MAHKDTYYDVVICGSGSAGLAAANWLARYGIKCKVLDRRDGPMRMGQADGVQCRTVEIFESLGLVESLLKDAYHVLEVTFWSRDGQSLRRNRRTADTRKGLSHQPHVILNQAIVNRILIQDMKERNNQTIDYGYEVKGVEVDETTAANPNAHCVKIITEKDGQEEIFHARYVLGCDGAHSAVRHSLSFNMIGDSTNSVWGVMDVYPRTNFPDIRKKCVIHNASGSLIIIPREGGSLARFYIELGHEVDAKKVKLEDLHDVARQIFAPYEMEIADTHWWSAYSIGQRLADNFHKDHRVFLTGDACHTHSPKAGQGMNVSLQDGYNIGWKLGALLTGQVGSDILKTYVTERSDVAAKLIDFDREWTKLFAQMSSDKNAVTPEHFAEQFIKNAEYTAGLTARYGESILTTNKSAATGIAQHLVVGMRFPSTQVVRHCDARALQLLKALPADGRWRIMVFAGALDNPRSTARLQHLSAFLDSSGGPIHSASASVPYIDSFIEPLLILSGNRVDIEQDQIPSIFSPITGRWGMKDLSKTFLDDESYNSTHGQAYDFYGISPIEGAVVIIRPDQYIAKATTMDDFKGISEFFSGFSIRSSVASSSSTSSSFDMVALETT